jgi:hypothetical protein
MGYRIEYSVHSRAMVVRVSGCTHSHAKTIAREIQREAKRAAVRRLVLDVRELIDRFGNLGTLVLGTCRNRRVAVIDEDQGNPLSHSQLRYFADPNEALTWLAD